MTPGWTYKPFAALTNDELYTILALRQRVFVVEQNCPYIDADGADPKATHLYFRDDAGTITAYARLFGPGIKYPECSIGRVITAPEVRSTGLGKQLVAECLRHLDAEHGPRAAVTISAQAHLQRFYSAFGFEGVGDEYLEDDIPHRAMVRR